MTQKTIYYSKKYMSKNDANGQATVVAKPARRKMSRMGILMLVVGMVAALAMVLLAPLLVDGAPPAANAAMPASRAQHIMVFSSPRDALDYLGAKAALPGTLPEGYGVAASRVVDGTVLELEITNGSNQLVFCAAEGSDDLSGQDYEEYTYTATETTDGIARGYAGVSAQKLSMAVWANEGYAYAIVAEDGIDAAQMRDLAESVK